MNTHTRETTNLVLLRTLADKAARTAAQAAEQEDKALALSSVRQAQIYLDRMDSIIRDRPSRPSRRPATPPATRPAQTLHTPRFPIKP